MPDEDVIQSVLRAAMEVQPSFTENQALLVESRIRRIWGGEMVKIAKRAPVLRKARERVRAQIGIKSPGELASEHDISRATLYRWIKK